MVPVHERLGCALSVTPRDGREKHVVQSYQTFVLRKCALSVDGQQIAEGRIPKTQPFVFSADEGVDVGLDGETAVSTDYKQGDNRFTGKIANVTIDTKPANLSNADKKTVDDRQQAAAAADE